MQTPSGDVERHEIGGRGFLTVREATVAQDFHFLGLVSRAGIDRMSIGQNEEPEDFARRLLEHSVRSGAVLELLGCLLVPEEEVKPGQEPGEAWTVEGCKHTARHIGKCKSADDKAKINALVLSLLITFFESGIVSLWTSRTSFEEAIPTTSTTPDAMAPGQT